MGTQDAKPIIDLHCDLLAYLDDVENADAFNREDIGCAVPHLLEGNVKIQVAAVWAATAQGSSDAARRQFLLFQELIRNHGELLFDVTNPDEAERALGSDKTGLIFAIENVSTFCEEDEPLERGLARLDGLYEAAGRILYITLTHFGENRFGGGSPSTAGLKKDGMALLEHLSGRDIAVDLSHAGDELALGILDYVDRKDLPIPVMASHSNFRALWNHPRNLTDDVAKEIVRREGLIGICFMKEYLCHDDPAMLQKHVEYAFDLGAREALCLGADFFCTKSHPDQSRAPFFFREHEHAGRYQQILRSLKDALDEEDLLALAFGNALRFLNRIWKG